MLSSNSQQFLLFTLDNGLLNLGSMCLWVLLGNTWVVCLWLQFDTLLKWPEVCEMASTTAANMLGMLRQLFAFDDISEQNTSDNRPQLVSTPFAEFMRMNGVKQICFTPYDPSSNRAAQRFVRNVKVALKDTKKDGRALQQHLKNFLFTNRTVPHVTSRVPPCTLFLGCIFVLGWVCWNRTLSKMYVRRKLIRKPTMTNVPSPDTSQLAK